MTIFVVVGLFLVGGGYAWDEKARLEGEVVEVLKDYAHLLENSLTSIREYVDQVNEVYTAECPFDSCSQYVIRERILGNPIYNYQLLKRLIVFFKKVEDSIAAADSEDVLHKLEQLKRKYGGMPSEAERQGAAKTLLRLLDTYSLDVNELAEGVIGGEKTGARLDYSDSYYLGQLAAANRDSSISVKLLEHAFAASNFGNRSDDMSPTQAESLERLLNVEKARAKLRDMDQELASGEKEYRLGVVPPKTSDRVKIFTSYDKENYKALCKGEQLLGEAERRKLTCYHSSQGQPYYTIHPLQIEILHTHPHQVVMYHHVLSDSESDQLVQLTQLKMKRAGVGQDKTVTDDRVSRHVWIEDNTQEIVDRVTERMNWITGLETSMKYDRKGDGKKEEYEFLQIASYGIGGHFYLHFDPLYVYKDSNYIARSIESTGDAQYATGDRMSTLMFYLTDVEAGGFTAFPRLGIASRPEKGSAVFWHNIDRAGFSDMHMLHAACPVLLGKKVVANKWVREVANSLNRPCGLTVTS